MGELKSSNYSTVILITCCHVQNHIHIIAVVSTIYFGATTSTKGTRNTCCFLNTDNHGATVGNLTSTWAYKLEKKKKNVHMTGQAKLFWITPAAEQYS